MIKHFTAQQIIARRMKLWDESHSIEKDREFREAIAKYMTESAIDPETKKPVPAHPELLKEIEEHPEYLVEMFFIIVDKKQQTVPFFFNSEQRKLINHIAQAIEDYKAGKRLHLKFLVLKGRQFGATTAITAYQLARAITQKNFSGITLADVIDNTNTIFEKKAKFPYNNLPELIQPVTKYNNRREFLFSKLNSSWYISTAGNKDVGRSNTINFFHGSEAAFWGSISDIVTGLGEALTKDSIQVLESTANGFNEFKDLWDGAPDNTWEALFFYWWDTVEYRMEYESPKKQKQFESDVLNEGGDSEELQKLFRKLKHLKDTYNLEWNQLYWYYNKWKGYIDKEKIKQEYPCNPREAFLASGRCVFNTEVVQNRIDELEILYKNKDKAPRRGFFSFKWHDEQHKDYILDETITWVNDPQGYVWIYEDPQPMIPYAIGGDTKGEGKDFYAASCKDNTTGKRKAYIEAQFYHSKPFTWQVYCMGRYYHNALIGIEMNWNTAPIEELERLSYPSQYIRQKYDSIQKQIEPRYGWKTDGVTRPYMIDAFIELVNEHPELFPHIPMLNQCLTFIYDEENRPDAEVGKHDDILLSDMILEQISTQQTHNPIKQEVKLEGFYTESELEDMGYSPREIQRILSTQKSY